MLASSAPVFAADLSFAADPVVQSNAPDICLVAPVSELSQLLAKAATTPPPSMSAVTEWELLVDAGHDEPTTPAAAMAIAAASGTDPADVVPKKEFFGGKFSFITKFPSNFAQRTAALSAHITEKFRVEPEVASRVVNAAMEKGTAVKIPASLILAIISVESSFKAEAQNGNATGLMQIIPRWHKENVAAIGGPTQLSKIENNIATGSKILREYLDRSKGNLFNAVYRYNASPHASAYAQKVLKEQKNFENVMKME